MNAHRMRFIREKVLETRREEEDHGAHAPAAPAAPGPEACCVLEGLDVLDVGCGGGILSEVRI
jgi:2-polyprenyl-6-hydroxyphenyl methylase/3-demethylubiquinone-9 3-methyltransferase